MEGMRPEVIEDALRRAGATILGEDSEITARRAITKADMVALGLSGTPDAARRRQALLRILCLPEHLTANALLQVLDTLYSYEELAAATAGCGDSSPTL